MIGVVSNNHVVNPSVYKNIPFDSLADITPITILGATPFVLVAPPSVPVKTVQELGLPTPEGWFNVNYKFIGMDLAETPWTLVKNFTFTWAVIGVILIPILAGLSQFVLSKITMNSQPQANAGGNSMKSMMYTMPLFSVYIAFIMPAALGVYGDVALADVPSRRQRRHGQADEKQQRKER